MLTTADGAGVGSPRSGRRALLRKGPQGTGWGRRAGSFRRDDKGGDEVRKRSWLWRLAAVVAALALALGLAACGDDDDSGDSGDTSGGDATTLDVAYVTTQQHPYGIAIDAFAEQVNGTGQLTINPQPVYPQSEIQLLDDVRSGVVPMATISSAIWDTAGITAFQALQAPFLITNYPLAEAVEGGEIGQSMLADANEQAGDIVALAIHEGGLRKPFGATKKLVSVDVLPGHDDPRPAVAGAGGRLPGDRRERRAAAAAGRLPGAPERHGRRRRGQPAADLHAEVVRGGQVRHRQRQLLALPDGAGRQQGGLRRPQRRPADGPDRRRRGRSPRRRSRSSPRRAAPSPRTW